jgi:SAM-dependent methyltransferase
VTKRNAESRAHHQTGRADGHRGPGGLVGQAWTRQEAIAALESPDRWKTQDPEALWTRLGLAPGATVVDVGAGTGYFALPAARRVGPSGRVYAVDLSADLVDLLRERRDREALPQLLPVENTRTSIPLPSAVADWVLLANVLHDVPDSTVEEAVRMLKPGGRLVNLDWNKEDTPGGPPVAVRLTPDEAERRLEGKGLRALERWEFGPRHYGLLLVRRSGTHAPRSRKRA